MHILVYILSPSLSLFLNMYICISLVVRVYTYGPGDWGSIPGWVIVKTQKMVLDASFLNTQNYMVWIKGKWNNPGKGVMPS